MMRTRCVAAMVALCLTAMWTATADVPCADSEDVARVLKTLRGPNLIDSPREATTGTGYLRFLGAPSGNYFETDSAAKTGDSGTVAKSFMLNHAGAFGMASPNIDYSVARVNDNSTRSYVRLQQEYMGLRVFAAQSMVQLDGNKNVQAVLSDIMRDTQSLDSGSLYVVPSVTPDDAKAAGIAALVVEYGQGNYEATEPELIIYRPSVVGEVGPTALAWEMEVASLDTDLIRDKVLVDAHSGSVLFRYPLVHDARNRKVYDSNNTYANPGTLARSEGQATVGIDDVDDAYDYLGDVYDFYLDHHGRDSIDNAGMTLSATVRFCSPYYGCPMDNAYWDGYSRMYFGEGFVADDVVGHELTHGVTTYTSGLIYANESGAINEAFSDIWGEFIDMTNGAGRDSYIYRWQLGEDLPGGAIRSMSVPSSHRTSYGGAMPDRYLALPQWYTGSADNGGVHHNCGVGNKLCYLITDGGIFNGLAMGGIGLDRTAELFYEVQAYMLPQGASYPDLGDLLLQATTNLGFTNDETMVVLTALVATEIIEYAPLPLRNFRATSVENEGRVVLTWNKPYQAAGSTAATLVRSDSGFPSDSGDGTVLLSGSTDEQYEDTGLEIGKEYYYGVFPVDTLNNDPLFARVICGDPIANPITEAFSSGTDLAFKQITFRPVASIYDAVASNHPEAYVDYTRYETTIVPGSDFGNILPVRETGTSRLAATDDGFFSYSSPVPIPFFGEFYSNFTVSANGSVIPSSAFVAHDMYAEGAPEVTIADHMKVPRISFLHADLDPQSGGSMWGTSLDDRLVLTFENVPEYGSQYGNTVQCEIFYSGQIRFTYLNLSVERAIVGLSDGRGAMYHPVDVANHSSDPRLITTDLTASNAQAPFELHPIPLQYASEGDTVEFTAEVTSGFVPVDFVLEGVTFAGVDWHRIDDTSYQFSWVVPATSHSGYSFIVKASAGGYTASQWVDIYVTDVPYLPVASNLTITPAEPRNNQQLTGTYSYTQMQGYAEYGSTLYWFKNNALVPAFTDFSVIPDEATSVGDQWRFTVTPRTAYVDSYTHDVVYVTGETQTSSAVTILPNVVTDANKDGAVNSVDVQMVVRGALGMSDDASADVDGDGKSTAVDVQYVLNAALGGSAE